MQIERADGAARSLPFVAVERHEDGGPAELLDNARRHDADDAGMPSLFGEHNAVRRAQIQLLGQAPRAIERATIDLLPAFVQLLELARDHVRLMFVGGAHQLHAAYRVRQAAGGVEARGDDEADATRGEWPIRHPARPEQRADARPARLIEQPEPVTNEH